MLSLIIDNRESALIEHLKTAECVFEVEQLKIGDILIRNESSETIVIIERKTVADLISSIKDGRYREQGTRLSASGIHPHYVYYLIEGKFGSGKDREMVMSALVSLSYFKGFSVMRSNTVAETALIVQNMLSKISKETERRPFYTTEIATDVLPISEATYNPSLIRPRKADNITPENFFSILLCQVPSVSDATAKAVCEIYPDLRSLLQAVDEDPNCLSNISYTTGKGAKRKISKTCCENICKYLCKK